MRKKILMVGCGYVGNAYASMFSKKYEVMMLDPPRNRMVSMQKRDEASLIVVCVPTPMVDGGACDTRIVESVVREHAQMSVERNIPILIKSTVEPGTTYRLSDEYEVPLIFSPEYIGEGGYWVPPEYPQPTDPISHRFVILGESDSAAISHRQSTAIIDLMMPVVGPSTQFRVMNSVEAELTKYFENAYLALKVTFANEMRTICEALAPYKVRYHTVREGWLDDPRVGRSHSAAFAHRPGFDGKCLPKDTSALAYFCLKNGISAPLLDAMIKANLISTSNS